MDLDHDSPRRDASADAGGDPACWLDHVRDCCGSLEGEPHRRDCAEPQHTSDTGAAGAQGPAR